MKNKLPATTLLLWLMITISASAIEYYVDDVATNGVGSWETPFNSIQLALDTVSPGDVISILPGNYAQDQIDTSVTATSGVPITVRAYDPENRPILTRPGAAPRTGSCILSIDHPYYILDGLIFDGEWQFMHGLYIDKEGHNAIVQNCEVRYFGADGTSVSGAHNVLFDNTEIHHCLRGTELNRDDAHGITGVQVVNLTVRNCDIHHVTGDSLQIDPLAARGAQDPSRWPPHQDRPEWDNVLIENCRLWTGPINMTVPGWSYDYIPGENALDTKTNPLYDESQYRAQITVRNCEVFGWIDQTNISRRSAFNIKYTVDALIENCEVYNNEIAFRIRGEQPDNYTTNIIDGSHVRLRNIVTYGNDFAIRFENNIQQVSVLNCTFDRPEFRRVSVENGTYIPTEYFDLVDNGYPAAYDPAGFEMLNCLFVGIKPADAADSSNLSANTNWFFNLAQHDYQLATNSPALDTGTATAIITNDILGLTRSDGLIDVGAYEGTVTSLSLDPSNMEIEFNSDNGRSYQLETCTNLTNYAWTQTGPAMSGTGSNIITTVTNSTDNAFYRVKKF